MAVSKQHLILTPGGRPEVRAAALSYDEIVTVVGYPVEIINILDGTATMYLCEDGNRRGMPLNENATKLARASLRGSDYISGTALIVGPVVAGGVDSSLSDDMLRNLMAMLSTDAGGARFADIDYQIREELLDLMWAAWFASRPAALQQLVFRGLQGDEVASLNAAQWVVGDDFKLRALADRLAGSPGHRDAESAIAGLLEGSMMLQLPPRLQRVVAATDSERSHATDSVRRGLDGKLNAEAASDLSATLAFLVEAQPTSELTVLERSAQPEFLRTVLSGLGLPSSYEAIVNDWVLLASNKRP